MGRLPLVCFLLALGTGAQKNRNGSGVAGNQKANSSSSNGTDPVADYYIKYTFGAGHGIADANYRVADNTYNKAGGIDPAGNGGTTSLALRTGIEKWCNNNGHSHSHNSPGGSFNLGECADYHPQGSCADKFAHMNNTSCAAYEPHNTRVSLVENPAANRKFVDTVGWKGMVDASRCFNDGGVCKPLAATNCAQFTGLDTSEASCNAHKTGGNQACVWKAKGFCIPLLLKEKQFENAATDIRGPCNAHATSAACAGGAASTTGGFSYCIWVDQQAAWGSGPITSFPPNEGGAYPASRSDYAALPKVCRAEVDASSCLNKNSATGTLAKKAECIADSKCDWIGCGHNDCANDASVTNAISVSCVATEVCDAKGVVGAAITDNATYVTARDTTQTNATTTCNALTDQKGCEGNKDCTWDKHGGTFGTCNAIECRSVSVGACHSVQPNAPSHCQVQRLNDYATAYGGRAGSAIAAGAACSSYTTGNVFGTPGAALASTTSQADVDAQKTACLARTLALNSDAFFNATGGQGSPDTAECEWIEAGLCDDACKSGNDEGGCTSIANCAWIFQAQDGGNECNPQNGSAAGTQCNAGSHIGDNSASNVVGGNGAPSAGTFRLGAYPTGELQVSLGADAGGVSAWYTVCADTWGLEGQFEPTKQDTFDYWCQSLGYPLGASAGSVGASTAPTPSSATPGSVEANNGYAGTLTACSNTTGSLGATCTTDGNPIHWASATATGAGCGKALSLTCQGPRGGYRHNIIPGLQADIARACDFSPIQIAHARILTVSGGVVTAALRLATKLSCKVHSTGADTVACLDAANAGASTGDFATADKGSIQLYDLKGAAEARIGDFAKGLTLWASDPATYGAAGTARVTFNVTGLAIPMAGNNPMVSYRIANVHSWPLIAAAATHKDHLLATFAHIEDTSSTKQCTVLNKLGVYTTGCPRGATTGTENWNDTLLEPYISAAALDAYVNGDRQYYPDKVCNFILQSTAVNGHAAPAVDTAACDAAFDCMSDKNGGSATSEEVERCSLNVLAAHYDKSIDELMSSLPSGAQEVNVSSVAGTLASEDFAGGNWSYKRESGGIVNLINAAAYNASVREAWYDSFSEHNNWTKHAGKLCTADAAGFRLLLTNTNGASGPRGPFVAGFDKVFAGAGNALSGDGNDKDRRSNRVGWQNPRCGITNAYKGYANSGTGDIHTGGGEELTTIPNGATGAFNGIGGVNSAAMDGGVAFEEGNNWGAQYRGPSSFCTGGGQTFTINRTKGGCAGTANPCSAFNGAGAAAEAACAAAGCTHDGAAACEGQPLGCAAYTTAATCGATGNGCAWSESAATLGTVSSLGQCKRLCRSNIDCQAVTVLSWAPPQTWSDASVQGNGLAYPQGCMAADATDLDDDDSCKGSKAAAAKTSSQICVLCPHTPGTLAAEPAAGAAGSYDSYRAGAATHVRSGRGSGRQMAIYDITVYKGAVAGGNSVNLVKEAGGRQLRRSLQGEKPRMSIVASAGEVDEDQFKEAMADVMRANPHLRRFLAEEKVYPQRDEVIAANPAVTSATTNSQAPTGPQTQTKSKQSTENVASTSEEENMNSASRVLTTSIIALMSIYALLQ